MFAVVRTGGKQYRVAAGDKIVVEKLAGEAGDTVELGDVLLAGEGSELRSTDGLTVSAEIIAQAKGEKVTVFKKRRRHNYRRKKGHRQQHTILRITAIGEQKAEKPKKAAKPVLSDAAGGVEGAAPAADDAFPTHVNDQITDTVAEAPKKAKAKKADAKPAAPVKSEPTASEQVDSSKAKAKAPKAEAAKPKKASPKKPAADRNA
jgi:large subunit ribosomal protein L21